MNKRFTIYALPIFVLLVIAPPAFADNIHEQIKIGSLDNVRALITKTPELKSARDEMKLTPLHTAVKAGHLEIVKYLLEQDVDVNAEAYNRFTPLHFAEDPKIIKMLAMHKAYLEAQSSSGTPLQRATVRLLSGDASDEAKQGRVMAEALIGAGAHYDLISAVRLGDLDRVKVMVKADPMEALNKSALRDAAQFGRVAIVQFLLVNNGNPNVTDDCGMPVLYLALKHPDVVKVFIRAGADVKSPLQVVGQVLNKGNLWDGCTILHVAAKLGVVETVQLLIEAGVDVDARDPQGVTALSYAAFYGQPEIVKLLHKHKATLKGADGVDALHAAVSRLYYAEQKSEEINRYKAVITFLIKEGVPIDLRTAIVLGDLEQVKALVKRNPLQPEKPVSDVPPVLHLAVGLNQKDIVMVLLDGGAPIEGEDDTGHTALHKAAFWGRAEIAKILIDRGAKVDARTKRGVTPLSEAARLGNLGVAKVLVVAGADVNAQEIDGRTPLGNVNKSDKAMIEYLTANGGK